MTPAAFTLFVEGQSDRTRAVIERLDRFCAERLTIRASFLVVDVLQSPEAAEVNRIVATPTLIKHAPGRERRIVGDLESAEEMIEVLGLRQVGRTVPARIANSG